MPPRTNLAAALPARGLFRHVVHEIVDVQHVAAGENAGHVRFERLVDCRAAGHAVECHLRALGKLVLRQKADGEQKRVARDILLRTRHRLAVRADLSERDALEPFPAVDIHDRVAEQQGDAVVVQALHDVALEPAGVRQKLGHAPDVRALERHAARHDEADIAAAEDDDLASGHEALKIHEPLRRAGGVDARRAVAGNVQRPARPFTAAHGENDGAAAELLHAAFAARNGEHALVREREHHRRKTDGDAQLLGAGQKTRGVLRAGQLLAERVQTEAVVDALVQNAAGDAVALDDEHIVHARLLRGDGGSETGRTGADDDDIVGVHAFSPSFLVLPTIGNDAPPLFVSCSCGTPSSRERISSTRGEQKPA